MARYTVLACMRRRDGQYLVIYRDAKRESREALSDWPVPVSSDVRIEAGRVV